MFIATIISGTFLIIAAATTIVLVTLVIFAVVVPVSAATSLRWAIWNKHDLESLFFF